MSSNPKMPTTSGITIDRLFSKKISFIKLPVAFSASIPEEKAYTMSWNDQIFAEESRNYFQKYTKILSSYRLAELFSQLTNDNIAYNT